MSKHSNRTTHPKVVAYIRESTEKQVLETEGLEIQKERIIQFCQKNKYELVKIFSDEGISGAKDITERPALIELLNYCKNPPIQYVIIDKPDRLARKFENQLFIEMDLKRSKVDVLYATNETTNVDENDTDFDRMMKTAMRQMMGIFAELDRKMINKRLSDGKRKKAENGNKPSGRQPFGYEYSTDKKSTIVNPYQAKIIKEIFNLRASGKSFRFIADVLNKNRLTSDKLAYTGNNQKKKWYAQTVQVTTLNDYYIGKITHDGKKIDGNHKPIINLNVWNTVHQMHPTQTT